MSKKLEMNRAEDGQQNTLEIGTPDGTIIVTGNDAMMKTFFQIIKESETFLEIMRKNLQGLSRKHIADEMRKGGFDEPIAMDVEDTVIWADIIE